MKPVQLAVVGVGHLGRIHARLCTDLENARLVGVVDPSEPNRSAAAADLNVPAFERIDQLPDTVDGVIVATPTHSHVAIGTALARRGRHLLIEKPLAGRVAEADLLLDVCHRQGVILQVGHVERFNPVWQQFGMQLEPPRYADAMRTSGFPFRSTDIGVVLDLMIHDLDLVLSAVDSPVLRVEALGLSVLGGHEDVAQARITFQNGCVANFNASRVSYRAQRNLQLWTARGFASLDFAAGEATHVQPGPSLRRAAMRLDCLTAEQRAFFKDNFYNEVLEKRHASARPANALAQEQQQFVDCIQTGTTPTVCGRQGRKALAVAEQVLEAIAGHRREADISESTGPQVPLPDPAPFPAIPPLHRRAG